MTQKRTYIGALCLLGMVCARAQITNTGELGVAPGTQIGLLSDFDNTATATLSNNGELVFQGHFNNAGSLSFPDGSTSGTVRFQGNLPQQINGTGSNRFYELIFDNPSGPVAFELGAALEVAHRANFLQGVVNNRDFGGSLRFGEQADYTGASLQSFVDGNVQKRGNANFTFPIGHRGVYRKSGLRNVNGTAMEFVSGYLLENSGTTFPHNAYEGNIAFINDAEYWTFFRNSGSGEAVLQLSWDGSTTPDELLTADRQFLRIVAWNDGLQKWTDMGGVANEGDQTVASNGPVDLYGIFTLALVSDDDTDTDGDGVPDFVENNALPPSDANNPNDYPDSDGDGVPDYVENNGAPNSDPNDGESFADEDGDGIPDYVEESGVDTDGDGVPDFVELTEPPFSDPTDPDDFVDTDGDGVPDYVEIAGDPATDPNDPDDFVDTDGDGVPDYVEENGDPATDTNDPNDFADTDGDGVPDYVEENGDPATDSTDPNDFADTDGDGVPDYVEENGDPATDPTDPNDFADSDGDGVPDYVEEQGDPNNPDDFVDSDGDGVPDYVEENGDPATDPNNPDDFADSDGDGVPDYVEEQGDPATDPNDPNDFADTDGDGVPDYVEENGTPTTDSADSDDFVDTDGDGVPDYVEEQGTPPTDPNNPDDFVDSDGDGVPDYVEENSDPATNLNDPDDYVDSDGDGVPDYVEENGNPPTDPNNPADFADADGDGIPDYDEDRYSTTDILIENDLVSKKAASGHFEIVNIERFPNNTVEIFDRNGRMVFSTKGYDNASNAFRGLASNALALQDNKELPTGVYFYIVKYLVEGNQKTKNGYLYIGQ